MSFKYRKLRHEIWQRTVKPVCSKDFKFGSRTEIGTAKKLDGCELAIDCGNTHTIHFYIFLNLAVGTYTSTCKNKSRKF